MPSIKSPYFTEYGGNSDEQNLVQDLVDEQIQLFGQEVIYVPKTMLYDRTLADIVMKKYEDSVMIEMMLINVEGFGGSSAVTMTRKTVAAKPAASTVVPDMAILTNLLD